MDAKEVSIEATLQEAKKADDGKSEQVLMSPYHHIMQCPGKQVRTKLSEAFNMWLKINDEKLSAIAEITQMLHNASLLIDDIEDNARLRRGLPVAHNIFGVPHTINSANYLYFVALNKCQELGHPQATRVFTEQMLELHRGQGMDIYWRDSYTCPTEAEYNLMVIRKTGGLFGLAVRLMQLFSDNQKDFKPILDTLGLYFQVRDDYANLCSKEYEHNKSYCEDLTEGKFSFPIIHGILSEGAEGQIMSIVRQRTEDKDVKRYCVRLLSQHGSFDYTISTLCRLEAQLLKMIQEAGGNPILEHFVMEMRKIYQPCA